MIKIEIVDREYWLKKTRRALAYVLKCRREEYWKYIKLPWYKKIGESNPYGDMHWKIPFYWVTETNLRNFIKILKTENTGKLFIDDGLLRTIERNS